MWTYEFPFCAHVNSQWVLTFSIGPRILAPMYVDTVPNRNSRPAILLRQSRREGKRTIKTTLANMTDWPKGLVDTIRLTVCGETMVPKDAVFAIEQSVAHGHVQAVLGIIKNLGVDDLIASKACRERDLVVAMIVERIIQPCSKLATTRHWHDTTLAWELGVEDADEEDLYAAMDWVLKRQKRIENKLAKRHLSEGAVVLYDISSSSYYGHTCPLAVYGHNRDGMKLPCIVYGLLADDAGRPVAMDVYPGNTGDPTTVPDQVNKLRKRFGLSHIVLVGDRGMLTQTQIDTLREYPGLGWISALRTEAIRELVETKALQLSIFDQQDLAEITSDEFPGERLMACYNPLLAEDRKRTRDALLEATENKLKKIQAEIARRTNKPLEAGEIGVKCGKALKQHKMAKHFMLDIKDSSLQWKRNEARVEREASLDGIYVIRTSEASQRFSAQDTVRTYKSLSLVEQAFRCLKGVDLLVRPIRHRTVDHVRAHVFVCTLAYYVEWHMRKALAPVLFQDEELDQARWTRDPVAKAEPSASVKKKKTTHVTSDGWPVQSFQTLLAKLATRCRCRCRVGNQKAHAIVYELTEPTPFQAHIFDLLGVKP